ncbi:HMP-PP hydrolase (pyridoxal phosphatase) Cof, detected in genetic screen for thiamin metabolic genes (PMID:15292217) [hydrothermal vent metagenome]|uniref:HMP-PP hydrolase (Pyridoxal phosphatase) Cof, detected in genetic screen for thiamin metabolic genes (PMID:15292217) n=1 Tax=hydrothermal vent metagenome TaxID=652676 RepID=A0A3B1EA38_9ZZZZ
MIELVELDKQSHKFIIAYFLAKLEKNVDYVHLIEAGIFEFFRRVVVTDIRPDVFRVILKKKGAELNKWVVNKLGDSIQEIDDGKFLKKFEQYLLDENMYEKERFILKAASYLATKWEFNIIYQTSSFLSDIDDVKKEVDEEIEDYYELIGVRKIALNKKLAKLIDLSGRLRFQKRWAQTPRIPETSVLGHMLIVAIFGYFYSIKISACDKRLENNFFTALFHDLPEALTRDIITPVKYSIDELSDLISEYEIIKIKDDILPYVPDKIKKEFSYLLGLYNEIKDEFLDKTMQDGKITVHTNGLEKYNNNRHDTIDGLALKQCDKLSAFIEASISISHGIKSKELVNGKKQILGSLKTVQGINFKDIAKQIDKEFNLDG